MEALWYRESLNNKPILSNSRLRKIAKIILVHPLRQVKVTFIDPFIDIEAFSGAIHQIDNYNYIPRLIRWLNEYQVKFVVNYESELTIFKPYRPLELSIPRDLSLESLLEDLPINLVIQTANGVLKTNRSLLKLRGGPFIGAKLHFLQDRPFEKLDLTHFDPVIVKLFLDYLILGPSEFYSKTRLEEKYLIPFYLMADEFLHLELICLSVKFIQDHLMEKLRKIDLTNETEINQFGEEFKQFQGEFPVVNSTLKELFEQVQNYLKTEIQILDEFVQKNEKGCKFSYYGYKFTCGTKEYHLDYPMEHLKKELHERGYFCKQDIEDEALDNMNDESDSDDEF